MHLTKHHGLGNDFLITFVANVPENAADLAQQLCDRHRGIGADGLIFATPSERPGIDAQMTLINADGSGAEISGNGIRCLAQAIANRRGMNTASLVVQTPAGDRQLVVTPGQGEAEVLVRVDMGEVRSGPTLVRTPQAPGVRPLRAATFDIGNPHLVVLVDDPDTIDLAVAGPVLEADYDEGINVHFVSVEGNEVTLRVWERGAGITQACGSGAVVSAYATHAWGMSGPDVRVSMPGGSAQVEVGVNPGQSSMLIGPSVLIASIEVADA